MADQHHISAYALPTVHQEKSRGGGVVQVLQFKKAAEEAVKGTRYCHRASRRNRRALEAARRMLVNGETLTWTIITAPPTILEEEATHPTTTAGNLVPPSVLDDIANVTDTLSGGVKSIQQSYQ